jgi:hypothetical protein
MTPGIGARAAMAAATSAASRVIPASSLATSPPPGSFSLGSDGQAGLLEPARSSPDGLHHQVSVLREFLQLTFPQLYPEIYF